MNSEVYPKNDKPKKGLILFDLDGTLSILGDRLKYLKSGKEDWDSFFEACTEDLVNEPVAKNFRALKKEGYQIRIVSGRPERIRSKTLNWLKKNNLFIKSKELYMRADDDSRHDMVVKPELIDEFKGQVEMIFEDRNSMVDKWRELGFVCLQVAEGNF